MAAVCAHIKKSDTIPEITEGKRAVLLRTVLESQWNRLPTDRKGRKILTISRPFYTIIKYKLYFQQYFLLCFLDQIQENKAISSHTRRNNIKSLVLRCQEKRQVVLA